MDPLWSNARIIPLSSKFSKSPVINHLEPLKPPYRHLKSTPSVDRGDGFWYNMRMNGTMKDLYDEILAHLLLWLEQGNTELVDAHVERYRKMGWHFDVQQLRR